MSPRINAIHTCDVQNCIQWVIDVLSFVRPCLLG